MIESPYIHSNGQWAARSVIAGFFTAPIEALPEVTVTDVVSLPSSCIRGNNIWQVYTQYFTHERGSYIGLYACFLAGSNYFAPVICGFIAEYHGWQWVFYWPSIFTAVALVFLFFFMEETNYTREHVSSAGTDNGSHEHLDQEKADGSPMSEGGAIQSKKTYMQKLSILGPRQSRNNMLRRLFQTLYYLSWPVVFYAGWVSALNAKQYDEH